MSLKKDKLEHILQYSFQQFQQFGFSKVTMDEIAKGTQTGKGTLYRYFPSKEDLLLAALKINIDHIEKEIQAALASCKDPVEKINTYVFILSKYLKKVSLFQLSDIEKNVPTAYQLISSSRKRIVNKNFKSILLEGKEKGIFRDDLNIDFVIQIFIGSTQYLTQPDVLDQMPYIHLSDIIDEMCAVLLNGCYTK